MERIILSFVALFLMTACGKQGSEVGSAASKQLPTEIYDEDVSACEALRTWDMQRNISVTVHSGWLIFSPSKFFSVNLAGKTTVVTDGVVSMKDCDVTVADSKIVSVVDVVVTPAPTAPASGCNWWGQCQPPQPPQPTPGYGGFPGYGGYPNYGH